MWQAERAFQLNKLPDLEKKNFQLDIPRMLCSFDIVGKQNVRKRNTNPFMDTEYSSK